MRGSAISRGARLLLAAGVLLAIGGWIAREWPARGLWYDETVNAYFAQRPLSEIWEWCARIDNQMPLDFVLRRLWAALAGSSEFALRFYSAEATFVAAAAVIALGRRLSGRVAGGALAGLAFAASQSTLYAAYEVRPYALALALYGLASLVVWSLWSRYGTFVRPLDAGYWARLAAYLGLALALLYTHYTAILALAAHGALLVLLTLMRPTRRRRVILFHLAAGIAAGFLPWLGALAGRDVRAGTAFGAHVPPWLALRTYAEFYAYGQNVPPAQGAHFELIIPCLVALGLLILLWKGWHHPAALDKALYAALLVAVPLALLVLMVFAVQGKLSGRHAWPAWIGAAVALGAGPALLPRIGAGRWLVGLLVVAVAGWPARLATQPMYNSYLREAFAYVDAHAEPHDVLVLRDGTLFTAARYYGAALPWIGLPPDKLTDVNRFLFVDEATEALDALVMEHEAQRVWVLSWQGDIMDPQDIVGGVLNSIGRRQPLPDSTGFGDVHLSLYTLVGAPAAVVSALDTAQPLAHYPRNGPILLGAHVLAEPIVARGGWIEVQTWWLRGDAVMPGARISVRLYALDGTFYAQLDRAPSAPSFGQELWQPDVPVLGRTFLQVPDALPVGLAEVKVVLYDVDSTFEPIIVPIGDLVIVPGS